MIKCRKRSYANPVEAMLALNRIQSQRDIDNLDKHERCWYLCTNCGNHHLTSWRNETGP